MRWLLPVLVSGFIVLLYVTPEGARLRQIILPADTATGKNEVNSTPATDDDDDDEHPSRLRVREGMLGIELTPEAQVTSGVEVEQAQALQYRREIRAMAEVISIQPLLELRTESERLRAEIRITEVQLQRSREAYERLAVLHEDDANISARQMEEGRAQMQAERARLASQKQQLLSLRDRAVQLWGEVLAAWTLDTRAEGLFDQLLNRRDVLLKLSLARDQSLPASTRIIFVHRNDERLHARKAYLISAAPGTEPGLQGETYVFRTRADKLRVGMRLYAWIPVSGELVDGIYVPASAVVWHVGQPWIYLHDGDTFFYRRTLKNPARYGDGWFVSAEQIAKGQQIVTTGAQMLLSEEYRWQIPDEDDDP